MRYAFVEKPTLICAGICIDNGIAGVGRANYAASGSFELYWPQSASALRHELSSQPAMLEADDPEFAPDYRSGAGQLAADGVLAWPNP